MMWKLVSHSEEPTSKILHEPDNGSLNGMHGNLQSYSFLKRWKMRACNPFGL